MTLGYKLIISCYLFVCCTIIHGQDITDLSFNLQVYPTGIITQLSIDKTIGPKSLVGLRIGSNVFRHRDLGVHDDEKGQGFGFTPTYTYYFNENRTQWNITLKNDFWWSSVDWYDLVNTDMLVGESDIIVLQPTADIAYTFVIGNSFIITPSLAAGWEWNIKTTGGEPTGGLLC